MENITEQQKAEARAYNDKIKYNLCFEALTEMLFSEVLDYVNKKIGDDGLKALDKIIVRLNKDDYKIALKFFMDGEFGVISAINYQYNITIKDIKEALEVLKIDLSENGELARIMNLKLEWDNREDIKAVEAIQQALKGKYAGGLSTIKQFIAMEYYHWFVDDLLIIIKNIIDNYSDRGESLKPKVNKLLAKVISEKETEK